MTTIGYTGKFVADTVQPTDVYEVIAHGPQGEATPQVMLAAAWAPKPAVIFTSMQARILTIGAGGTGRTSLHSNVNGGGAGTFVVAPGSAPLVIAGGGGGDRFYNPSAGVDQTGPARGNAYPSGAITSGGHRFAQASRPVR